MAENNSARVSTLELFFDLVFVFTITQVALIVEHHPGWRTIAQAAVELAVIYWMYGGFAWLTNTIGSDTNRKRALLLVGMAAFFIVSLAVPRAFADDGISFGIAYLALTLVHLIGFLLSGVPATIASMLRVGTANMIAALLILAAGFTHGDAHWPLWLLALAVQWISPALNGASSGFVIDVDHFAERHGLMIIIVLGESLVSVALAAQELPVGWSLVTGALCGLAASAAMWWAYFDGEDDAAAEAMRSRPTGLRGTVALFGYDLPHVVMMAGIISVAVGTRLSLPTLTARAEAPAAWLISAGAAIYLGGLALFRTALGFGDPLRRLLGGLVALAVVPIGVYLGAAQELLGIAVVISAVLLVERRGRRSTRVADQAR